MPRPCTAAPSPHAKASILIAGFAGIVLEMALSEIDLWRQQQIAQREVPELMVRGGSRRPAFLPPTLAPPSSVLMRAPRRFLQPQRAVEAEQPSLASQLPPWFPVRQVDPSSRVEVLKQEIRDLETALALERAEGDAPR